MERDGLKPAQIKFFHSLTGQLLTISLLFTLVPLILLGILSYLTMTTILTSRIEQELQRNLAGQDIYIRDWLEERQKDIQTLAGAARVRSMEPDMAQETVEQYYALWGQYETMFVANPEGDTIAIQGGSHVNLIDREYFQQSMRGELAVSQPLVSRATGNIVVVVSAPVVNDEGAVVGVAGGTIRVADLGELFAAMQMGRTGETYLVNAEGFFITPSRFTEELKAAGLIENQSELELNIRDLAPGKVLNQESGVETYQNYRGVSVLGAYQWIDGFNWGIVSEIEKTEAFEKLAGLRRQMVVTVALIAVITFVIVFYIFRRLAKRIQKMADIAGRLALGDTRQEVQVLTRDEIGQLAAAFQKMIRYQQVMARTAEKIADGDLTVSITPQSEVDDLGKSFERMIELLREALRQVQDSARELNAASRQMKKAAEMSGEVSSQIATTIQQVAQGSNQQAESISKTARAVEQMSHAIDGVARGAEEQARAVAAASELTTNISSAIQKVADNAATVTENASKASEAARKGSEIVQRTIQRMQAIKERVGLSSEKMKEMSQRSDQIGVITETIEDIASQTNLLALNAAIEAARAGEHGKGFAVVADEVRKLAERAAASTREITSLIKTIQQTVAEATEAMNLGTQEVDGGVVNANDAGAALSNILAAVERAYERASGTAQATNQIQQSVQALVDAVDAVSAVVEENTAATEEMTAHSGEVSQAIENIASVSEENSAALEEVSAATEEMSAQAQDVAVSAHSLSEMANELDTVAGKFKL